MENDNNFGEQSSFGGNFESVQIFVGDLSFNVDENLLKVEFEKFGEVLNVKIIRNSDGSSKGYGFISYCNKQDADKAIQQMNRINFHGKNIKCNWATRNSQLTDRNTMYGGNNAQKKSLQDIFNETILSNSDVYVAGRLISEELLRRLFQEYGRIISIKAYPERGHAFIKFDSHDSASMAIFHMDGQKVDGQNPIRCNWGRKSANENGWERNNARRNGDFSMQQQLQQNQQQMQNPNGNANMGQQANNAMWNQYPEQYYALFQQQYQQLYNQQILQQQQQQPFYGQQAVQQQFSANNPQSLDSQQQQQLYQQFLNQQQY